MAIYTTTGAVSIGTIASGSYTGGNTSADTLTTTNQILGGSFTGYTFLSVPTNTESTQHLGAYGANINMEMTNSGSIQFSASATGDATVTKGPPATIDNATGYSAGLYYWGEDNGFLTIHVNSLTALDTDGFVTVSGLSTDGNSNLYYEQDGKRYTRGTLQNTDGGTGATSYQLTVTEPPIKAIIVPGGVTITIAADDGTNNTEYVELAEFAFTVTVVSPGLASDMRLKLPSGVVTSTLVVTAAEADRGDTVEYAYRSSTAAGFSMKYGSFVIGQLAKGGTQTETVTATFQPYPRAVESPSDLVTTITVGTFANSILPLAGANLIQAGAYMNKVLCEAVGTSNETFLAMFGLTNDNFFGSDGSLTFFNANSDKIQITSTTAISGTTEETLPYFRPTNSTAVDAPTVIAAQFKFGQGSFLGQSYDLSPITPADVANEVVKRMGALIEPLY